jgi:hypothetical protein
VLLVEPLAVVRVDAPPDLVSLAEAQFEEPVGVGERLPRGADGGEVLVVLVEELAQHGAREVGDAAPCDRGDVYSTSSSTAP